MEMPSIAYYCTDCCPSVLIVIKVLLVGRFVLCWCYFNIWLIRWPNSSRIKLKGITFSHIEFFNPYMKHTNIIEGLWVGLWWLTPLSTIFPLYRCGHFHWWHTISHNLVASTPRIRGVQTHNVSGNRHWLYG